MVCQTIDQIALMIEQHDGRTETVLYLEGTNFMVRLGGSLPFHRARIVRMPSIVRMLMVSDPVTTALLNPSGEAYARQWLAEAEGLEDVVLLPGNDREDLRRLTFEAYAKALSVRNLAIRRGFKVAPVTGPDDWEILEIDEPRFVPNRPGSKAGTTYPPARIERARVARELRKLPRTEEGKDMKNRIRHRASGRQVFRWRGPEGRIYSSSGESATQAAHRLGRVIGWDDDRTVVVMYRGKATGFALTDHGGAA